jgi:hypothetical protein
MIAHSLIPLSSTAHFWLINTDRKHGHSWERRMFYLRVASVTQASARSARIQQFKLIAPGDGLMLYANEVGVIVGGVAQSSWVATPSGTPAIGKGFYWDIPLGETWHRLSRPVPFDELQYPNMYGHIGIQINGTVVALGDGPAGHRVFQAVIKR